MSSLHEYIKEGEHESQDFKFRIDDQKKIARTLSAFANTVGGRLLIGVKDNGKVVGVDPQEEFYMIEGAASLFCKPPVEFTSKIWQEDHKIVLEIDVPRSEFLPHRSPDEQGKWRPYVRVEDETIAVGKIQERVWAFKKNPVARPEKFGEEELTLLRLIQQFQPVKVSKLYRSAGIPFKEVDRLLVLLICWNIVEMIHSKEGTKFRLK
jgi:predicted HTH transcriptional regulator